MNNKLKPVVFIKGHYTYGNDYFKQNLLLKAMQVTDNPYELKKMIGVKTVAEVFRTLDKLAIRKEYHQALIRNGIDLDTIINGIKKEGEKSENSSVRLKAWTTLLKSLGLDEYKEGENTGTKSWEDLLMDVVAKEKENKKINKIEEYKVIEPTIPKEVKEKLDYDEKIGKEMYDRY